jgi:hypothetical protein
MSGQIKIGETVETPHGKGVIVKVERYKQFRRWAVLFEKSPFSFNPVWYHHKHVKATTQCDCIVEYNDDHHGTLVYKCSKCK